MAHPPPHDCDTSPTRISGNWFSPTDTRSFQIAVSQYASTYTTGYYQSCEIPENRKIETKKEKLDRTSKEKMLASHRIYDQKDMNVIKLKHDCKPQHRMSYRYKR